VGLTQDANEPHLPATIAPTTLGMMSVDEKIRAQIERVVALGVKALATERKTEHGGIVVDEQLASQWVASARNLLAGVFGRDSDYFERFKAYTDGHLGPNATKHGHGVILAAQADYLADGIFKVRHLVEAEIFDDFLEHAEHLLSKDYFHAAAVIAGCVLEDALRKLCAKHGVTLPAEPKLDSMNAELAKKGAYDKLVQKRITAEADLRNKAAHGKWTEFRRDDVESMISWVRRFLVDYPS
jgi:hypothetical protein